VRLTTKGRFAVTAMIDLAMIDQVITDQVICEDTRSAASSFATTSPVTLASISERQGISLAYLEQLFGKLRKRGIVVAVRGPGGGYSLARPSTQISIADIIAAVDEPVDATRCGGKANCREGRQCLTHDLWEGLTLAIDGYLSGVSLQQVINSQQMAKKNIAKITLRKRVVQPRISA